MADTINSEKFLYKLILQFSVFTRGSSSLLDPHLSNITQRLKQGSNYQDLIPELQELSKTLLQISSSGQSANIDNDSEINLIQQQHFLLRLKELLSNQDVPIKFQRQCSVLKKKSEGILDDKTYIKVVDSATKLLINIKNYVVAEQQYIESFLAHIPKQLTQLEDHTLLVSDSNKLSIENRESLNDTIEQQVDIIKTSTSEAKELSSLQVTINQYLKELSSQFKQHKENEDDRQNETQKQIELMSHKIQEMEVESESLRCKLQLAHDKAYRDALTGLPNRLAYDDRINVEYNLWQQRANNLSLIIWDIDLFKLINDNFGHKAGDKTLVLVAQLIQKNCRETDMVARFGGEEFVMVLSDTTADEALVIANKIRELIGGTGFNHNGKSITLTISCGISQFSADDEYEQVFERADQALYYSKEHGRNQCSILSKAA